MKLKMNAMNSYGNFSFLDVASLILGFIISSGNRAFFLSREVNESPILKKRYFEMTCLPCI